MRRRYRPAVTFTDLVICVGMLVLIVGLSLRAVHKMGSRSAQVQCGSNLRQIGQSIMMYANENRGMYPRTRWNQQDPTTTQYTGATATNAFADNGPQPNDVTALAFYLIKTMSVGPDVFTCPDTSATGVSAPATSSNFPGEQNLSYSFANMYPSSSAVASGYKWNYTLGADFAVAADMNSGDPSLLTVTPTSPQSAFDKANSQNHSGDGQNVMFGDGHVEWEMNPFCGVSRDNIYTVSADPTGATTASKAIVGTPGWRGDTVMLPVSTKPPGSAGMFGKQTTLIFIIGGVILLGVVGLVVFLMMRKKPAAAGMGGSIPNAGYAPPGAPGQGAPARWPPPPPLPPQHR